MAMRKTDPASASSLFSLSQALGAEDKAKDQILVPCKRRREERHAPNLPREIIFNILVFIPAKVLHEVVRYVCKQWYDIVSDPLFVRVHCQMASAGFFFQDPQKILQDYYIEEADTARLNVTEIQIPFPARIFGSVNGLICLHDLTNPEIFHVMNPVTKAEISLPPVVGLRKNFGSTSFALNSSGHYKVVHVSGGKYENFSVEMSMRVFTVGFDKAWRFIDLQGIPMTSTANDALLFSPRFIGGFIYWCNAIGFFGFALDVDTETIYRFSKPQDFVKGYRQAEFINMGTSLGLMKQEGDISRLWKLTDVKSGEWTVVAGINMRAMLSRVDKMLYPSKCLGLLPVKLIDGNFWFFRRVEEEFVVVRYNLANESFMFFPFKTEYNFELLHHHVNTLLSPKNC